MKIIVTKPWSYEHNISVIVDGICNHFDTEVEEEEIDHYNPNGADSSETIQIETCQKCKCYRRIFDDGYPPNEWEGVEAMPL